MGCNQQVLVSVLLYHPGVRESAMRLPTRLTTFILVFSITAFAIPAVVSAQGAYFGRNKVQYQEFKFKVLKTDHFDVYYYPEEEDAAKMASRLAERWYKRLAGLFDHQLRNRQPLVLYASGPHFRQTNVIEGELGEGTGGVTEAAKRRIVIPFAGPIESTDHVLGHELGHAFHNECAYQAEKTPIQQNTPMTLAETASIMCETIATEAVLQQVSDSQEVLSVLEAQMNNASQVVVDIYSRYLFEKEVFERREKAELSADELCEIMERAQKATYGNGLDDKYLQKFMWTWKPHYYSSGFSFYNYPYTFGLLFATGLYAIYQKRGDEFVQDYKDLLASTGEDTAARLAQRFGIDITKRKFWDDSLAIIGKRVDRYCQL